MKTDELRDVLKAFGRIAPGFGDWRSRIIVATAASNGTEAETEWEEQLASWQRTLDETSKTEALEVIRGMETCEIEVPVYGELARTIYREARQIRASKTDSRQYGVDERRFRCHACLDRGMVNVWNPEFVIYFRADFGRIVRTPVDRTKPGPAQKLMRRFDPQGTIETHYYDPQSWEGLARLAWRQRSPDQPYKHLALCNCDGTRATRMHEERTKHYAGKRKRGRSLPACGAADYDPQTMPLATGLPYEDLAKWYELHPE